MAELYGYVATDLWTFTLLVEAGGGISKSYPPVKLGDPGYSPHRDVRLWWVVQSWVTSVNSA